MKSFVQMDIGLKTKAVNKSVVEIEQLELINFRNYQQALLVFAPAMNLFVSENGQGKTNMLEALYYCFTLKSFNKSSNKELIYWGQKQAELALTFRVYSQQQESFFHRHLLKIVIQEEKRYFYLDEKKLQKTSQLLPFFFPLYYSSQQTFSFRFSTEERRKLFDRSLISLYSDYYASWKEYSQILRQKNQTIKKGFSVAEIQNWNHLLAKRACVLVGYKQKYVQWINQHLATFFHQYSPEFADCGKKLQLLYRSKFLPFFRFGFDQTISEQEQTMVDIEHFLNSKTAQEIQAGHCLYGPHLDRFFLTHTEKKNRTLQQDDYFSEGQFCLAYYCLLLIIEKIFQALHGRSGIFLIDDLFQGIDWKIKTRVIQDFSHWCSQAFLTSHEEDALQKVGALEQQKKNKTYTLKQGKLTQLNS